MNPLSIAGLAAILFVKEAGAPIPVPGDLLVLAAGAAAAADGPVGLLALVPILLAGYAGGSVQFLLVRGTFRRPILRLLTRLGLPPSRLDSLAARLRRGGARAVAVARATPGVRVGAIAASGLAELPFAAFGPGLVMGNTAFVGGHFALGYVAGPAALGIVSTAGGAAASIAAVVLVVLAGAVWVMLGRRRRASADPGPGPVASWSDAACPVCVTVAAGRATARLRASREAATG